MIIAIRKFKPATLLLFLIILTLTLACKSNQEKGRKAVETYLQDHQMTTREMIVDMFHISEDTPGKAYIAVTVTYNFASSTGEFQKEHLAFVLKRDGQNWMLERPSVRPSK